MRDERLLGRIVIEWSKLENSLLALLWEFLELSFEDGRILCSKMDVGTVIQMLRALANRHVIRDKTAYPIFLNFLARVDELRIIRNLAVHGTWGMISSSKPLGGLVANVMSLRIKIEDHEGDVASETFSEERLREIIRLTISCRAFACTWERRLAESRDSWLIKHPSP
jgi:hypothetical protein